MKREWARLDDPSSDEGSLMRAIPTFLKSIDWPRDCLLKVLDEFIWYRTTGPWEVNDVLLDTLYSIFDVPNKEKLDPIILDFQVPRHKRLLKYLTLFKLPFTARIDIRNVTEQDSEGDCLEYLTRLVQFCIHEKQDTAYINSINVAKTNRAELYDESDSLSFSLSGSTLGPS